MKVLLRNVQTGLFYAGLEQWTEDPKQAADFERPDLALDQVRAGQLGKVELIVRFDDAAFDVPMTIVSAGDA
jgi:hypothetical protein